MKSIFVETTIDIHKHILLKQIESESEKQQEKVEIHCVALLLVSV